MFRESLLFQEKHEEIASDIASFFKSGININEGLIVLIFGISGTGKSEVAWWLSRKLYCKNFSSHKISLDRFYKIDIHDREDHRRRTDIIGSEEIDWERVREEVEHFKTLNKIDVLIIEGLYAGYIEKSNLRVYLQGTLESTYEFRKKRGKENPDTDWRKYILNREYESVTKSVKETDDIYIVGE